MTSQRSPTPTASPAALAEAYEECRRVTRREAKNFYFAFLTLPAQQRQAIYVAYTFCRYCDDSVDAEGSIDEKLARISRLRELLSETYDGHAQEPLFIGLADVAARYRIPQEYFQEVLNGVQSDLVKTRYADFDELRQYCYQVASVVGLICIHIFGYTGGEIARRHAIDLGLAMQLTNICRDVSEDWEFGRVYLPQDELKRFGVTEEDLAKQATSPSRLRICSGSRSTARASTSPAGDLSCRTSPGDPAPALRHWGTSTGAYWTASKAPDTTFSTTASRSAKARRLG